MSTPTLNKAIPVLLSRNLDHTIAFYDRLGFTLGSRYNDYLILSRDQIELHFSLFEELDPEQNACTCYIHARGVKTLYELWLHVGAVHPDGALHYTGHGMREFMALDQDKNLLRIGETMESGPE